MKKLQLFEDSILFYSKIIELFPLNQKALERICKKLS